MRLKCSGQIELVSSFGSNTEQGATGIKGSPNFLVKFVGSYYR